MLGLQTDAIVHTLVLTPHLPADWTRFGVANIRLGENSLELNYSKTESGLQLEVTRTSGKEECVVDFRPAMSPRAKVLRAELDGKPVQFKIEPGENDQHVAIQIPVGAEKKKLSIAVANEFGFSVRSVLPPLGSASQGLRILSETWSANKDRLDLEVSGAAGHLYELEVWNAGQVENVDGATLDAPRFGGSAHLLLHFPPSGSEAYPHLRVAIRFKGKASNH